MSTNLGEAHNNRFFEYQKIALEYYDLDILDVPNNDPSLAFDKKRKQEMVAHAMLFSLFERAFLIFNQQEDSSAFDSGRGGSTLNDFIRRESVRAAWRISRETYDTDFQKFMDGKIVEIQSVSAAPAALLEKISAPPIPPVSSVEPPKAEPLPAE